MAQEKYLSFTNTSSDIQIYYECKELKNNNFELKARVNKNNPDCQNFIKDKEKEGFIVKIIDLDPSVDQKYKNMVDIWIKKI